MKADPATVTTLELFVPETVHTPGRASPGCKQDTHEESEQIAPTSDPRGTHTLRAHVDGAKQLATEPKAVMPSTHEYGGVTHVLLTHDRGDAQFEGEHAYATGQSPAELIAVLVQLDWE